MNEIHFYKMPKRNSPHHGIEKHLSFNYLNSLKPNEHTVDCLNRGPKVKSFLFENEDEKII